MSAAPGPGAVLVTGEALIDLVPGGAGPGAPARHFTAEPGGAAVNVAVGLAHLGTPSFFAGGLGGDSFAAELEERLTTAGADVSLCSRSPLPTTLAVTDPGPDGTGYHFHLADTATFLVPPLAAEAGRFAAVYAGGLAAVVPPAADAVAATARAAAEESVLLVDPNVRSDRTLDAADGARRLRELCRLAHVVKASDEDLRVLWPEADPEETCRSLADGGRLVLLTRGRHGSVGFTADGERVAVAAAPVRVVNTIGAGDAFVAGVLHRLASSGALAKGGPLRLTAREAAGTLEFAGRVAASVVASAATAPEGAPA